MTHRDDFEDALTEGDACERLRDVAASLPPYPGDRHGRGVIVPGGGVRYFTCAWVCINMLRRLGCELPVELWHLGRREMTDDMRDLLAPLGVTTVDAAEVRKVRPARILNGWELKPYAILNSRFREVLLLDADNVPVVDPTFLFDTPEYREAGAIFWPDFGRLGPDRSVWALTGVPHRDEPEFETGQVVVDKAPCWGPLHLTMWMNEHSDFWYRHIHGDKETFHIAWRQLGAPYAMPPRGIDALDGVMCQHDFGGRRIFQHRNMAKWSLTGNRRIKEFMHEEQCLRFLAELRDRWRPVDAVAGPLSDADRAAARRLAGRAFQYARVGHDARPLRLGDHGLIADGAADREVFWWVRDGALVVAAADGDVTFRLRPTEGGAWEGRWLVHEQMPVRLEPAGGGGISP